MSRESREEGLALLVGPSRNGRMRISWDESNARIIKERKKSLKKVGKLNLSMSV